MRVQRKRIGDMLLEEGLVTEDIISKALQSAREDGMKLGEKLIQIGAVNEDQVATALSHQLDIARVDITKVDIDETFVNIIRGDILRKFVMIPLKYAEGSMTKVVVAMADPMDLNAIDEFSIITNLQVEPVVATPIEIHAALDRYYADSETARVLERYKREHQVEEVIEEEDDAAVDNSPVVILVRQMLEAAARQKASDIHIEPMEKQIRIRFRIDGVLHEKFKYEASMLPAIVARIKIIGGMDISEKRKPQDGRISIKVDNVDYDIRVSLLPTVYGEKCVMRFAQKNALKHDKSALGLRGDDIKKFDNLLQSPNGIMLVTGPTGSGKTTTLYTVLSELNSEDVNIITVEDPVEANIPGINQVHVNPKAELTFASALRSILRQDPDIIMIGEIRDGETAQIAVQASITGHIVVSTLHTNSAAGAVVRLMDMGVENYLLADSLFGVISQRLVRKLCKCATDVEATDEQKKMLGADVTKPLIIKQKCGCDECSGMGYKGRTGVYEILTVTPKVREAIHAQGNADEIKKVAVSEGMSTLRDSAAKLVLEGITTYDEMMRVAFEVE